jgi:type II secretory pathway pseudopilin PulG
MTKGGDVTVSRNSEAGFTLVEAMIAIVVLSTGLIAIANLMAVAMASNSIANQSTAAATVASQQLETLKGTQFTTLAAGGNLAADVAGYASDTTVYGVGNIHTRWTIAAVANPEAVGEVLFITVRSEAASVGGGLPVVSPSRTRAEFTTFRTCTDTSIGCP